MQMIFSEFKTTQEDQALDKTIFKKQKISPVDEASQVTVESVELNLTSKMSNTSFPSHKKR